MVRLSTALTCAAVAFTRAVHAEDTTTSDATTTTTADSTTTATETPTTSTTTTLTPSSSASPTSNTTSSNATFITPGTACPDQEDLFNCLTTSWQQCASGQWSIAISGTDDDGLQCSPVGETWDMEIVYANGTVVGSAPGAGRNGTSGTSSGDAPATTEVFGSMDTSGAERIQILQGWGLLSAVVVLGALVVV